MNCKLATIGVGNMAKAIIEGIQSSEISVSEIILYDKNQSQYDSLQNNRCPYVCASSVADAIEMADCVLLSVKPQNFPEILSEIACVPKHQQKLYVTIAAGITVESVSKALGDARVIRVLPNLPMTIGKGVSVICRNDSVDRESFDFVRSIFDAAGSTVIINENEMNRMIGVTSSSPAYVFAIIDAMYNAAIAQGLPSEGLIDAICDVFIGSAELLKRSADTPAQLVSKVASKGGTTERALNTFKNSGLEDIILRAMCDCTARADELGQSK